MSEQHAVLAPSASERWLQCPASIRLVASLDRTGDSGSEYAAEGTRAHQLAYIEAAYEFGLIDQAQHDVRLATWLKIAMDHADDVEEMERGVRAYVSLLRDLAAGLDGPVTVRLELRVETGVTGCFGTADAVLIGTTKIAVVDFKYGKGVVVFAEENPQLMLYSVGALEMTDLLGTIEVVGMSICQPRVGGTSHYTMSAADLRAWRDNEVAPVAHETRQEDAHFGPSEAACRWCPAAGVCVARAEYMASKDFGNPDAMDLDALATAFRSLAEIRDWCNAVEAEALSQAYSHGKVLPGLKVVLSGGRRSIADDARAIEALVAAGYRADQVSRTSTRTLSDLERLVGKQRLPEVLGELLVRSPGKPALVDEGDNRPAISPASEAAKDFMVEVTDE